MFLTNVRHYRLICALFIQTAASLHATIILQGDSTDEKSSFKQPIKELATGAYGECYVAAHKKGAQDFSIAVIGEKTDDDEINKIQKTHFFPLAPKMVSLDTVSSSTNPLYDAQIEVMTLMQGRNRALITEPIVSRVAVVTHDEPETVYVIDSVLKKQTDVVAAHSIKDASHTNTTARIINIESHNESFIFAAVTDSKSTIFGEGNSGLALLARQQIPEHEKKPAHVKLQQIAATFPINNKSNLLAIGKSDITIKDNAVSLCWNSYNECLYIGFNIQSKGQTERSGAQAIIVGKIIQNIIPIVEKDAKPQKDAKKETKAQIQHHIIMHDITPSAAFIPGKNTIVGGVGSHVDIAIHQIIPLQASTLLDYLVILAGVDQFNQNQKAIYALPLVKRLDRYNGVLAKKGAIPHTICNRGAHRSIVSRSFVDYAEKPEDLFTADDMQIQVGHGPITEGDITSIFAHNDAVYAVVRKTNENQVSGIFQSQAILDHLGRIKEWTAWRRVSSNFVDDILYASLNHQTGNMTMLIGSSADDIYTVRRTTWDTQPESNSLPITEWLNTTFPSSMGGVQGLFDIPVQTPGLDGISLLIATGRNQIALVQTGIRKNGTLQPLNSKELVYNPINFTDGTIDQQVTGSTNAITISGGALHELQIIKAAAITRIDRAGFIFVGGTHGLAVLLNDQGYSFDAHTGLGNNLTGLSMGTTVKKIGAYARIRKLVCDDEQGFLYIVSDSKLDRIDIRASDFDKDKIVATTLATTDGTTLGAYDVIFDAVISRSLCIMATSNGLYCNEHDLHWRSIALPEGCKNVKQIFCVTQTGREQDLTSGTGGNIYILNTEQGNNKAQVYRFVINVKDNDYSIEPFPDFFIQDTPSYFAQLPGYRSWIYTDGALFFHERDKNITAGPILALLPSHVHSGSIFGGNYQTIIPIHLENTSIIQRITRSSASGSWLLAQNNILSVNE
jgi:hypothetical protein